MTGCEHEDQAQGPGCPPGLLAFLEALARTPPRLDGYAFGRKLDSLRKSFLEPVRRLFGDDVLLVSEPQGLHIRVLGRYARLIPLEGGGVARVRYRVRGRTLPVVYIADPVPDEMWDFMRERQRSDRAQIFHAPDAVPPQDFDTW